LLLRRKMFGAWKNGGEHGGGGSLIDDERYYTHFADSVYGNDLRILKPVVGYSSEETMPRWRSPPVPFCHMKENPKWNDTA